MLKNKKYLNILLLLLFIFILFGCSHKQEEILNLDGLKDACLCSTIDNDLDNVLLNNDYQKVNSKIYYKNEKLVNNKAIISEVKEIENYTKDTNLINSFKDKYNSSFFNNHLLLMINLDYECEFYNVYYNGEDIEIITTNIVNSNTNNTYIFELDFSSIIDIDITIPGSLIKSSLCQVNIHSIDEAKTIFLNDIKSLPEITKWVMLNNNLLLPDEEKIFINALNNLTYIEATFETKQNPLFTIKCENLTLNVYNNKYFDITTDSGLVNAKIIDGSLLFALYYLNDLNTSSNYYLDILNFILFFEKTNVFSPEMYYDFVSFSNSLIDFEEVLEFRDFTIIERLEFVYDNVDKVENKDKLKEYLSLFKQIFKNGFDNTKKLDYTLTVLNNDICGKDIPNDIKTIKHNDLVDIKNYLNMIPSNRYLIGWADEYNNYLPINFNYPYYSDLNLILKTVSIDDYTIINGEITEVISNSEIVYLPLFDEFNNPITKITDNLFKDNETIKEVYINGNITTIGEHAFDGCTNLKKIVIGKNVTNIGDYAFANCPKLNSVTLEEGLTSLSNYMFANDISITSIYIPSTLKDLKDHVFEGCTSIETFIVSSDNPNFYSACNNIMEGTTLYYGCKNSTIPDGTVFIREFAFYGVTGLERIYIPSCVVHIDTSAFHNCSGLKYAYISQSVMWNAKNAFNTGYNTIIDCEYYQKMSGWVAQWTTGTTVNFGVEQPN